VVDAGHRSTRVDLPRQEIPPNAEFRLVTEPLIDIGTELRGAGLEQSVYELDLYGYTVLPDALDHDAVTEVAGTLLALAEEDCGRAIPLSGEGLADRTREVPLLLTRGGAAFERLVLHGRVLPLVTYLLGRSCTVSSLTGYVKGPGRRELGIHSDTAYVPDPLPPYAQVANVNYCLTDYSVAEGCLRIVPGSHRYCHRPRDGQGAREAVPVEAPAGAAIIFHGNTWHGAYARTEPGLRLTLSTLYCRMYMRPQERYDVLVGDEHLARNPERFRTLVGLDVPTGWSTVGEAERIAMLRRDQAPTHYGTRSEHA